MCIRNPIETESLKIGNMYESISGDIEQKEMERSQWKKNQTDKIDRKKNRNRETDRQRVPERKRPNK